MKRSAKGPNRKSADLVILTGLSGSGKSAVSRCFEDLGYYCVDNLPLALIDPLLDRVLSRTGSRRHILVCTDVRNAGFIAEFPAFYAALKRRHTGTRLLFVEADDEVISRRFSETRRPHPFVRRSLREAICRERRGLLETKGLADIVIDTSEYNIHELRTYITRTFRPETSPPPLTINIFSFGFKFGIPNDADLVFDVRFLPNPHFVPGLRERSGKDAPVVKYLMQKSEVRSFLTRLESFLRYLIPRYLAEHKSYLTIAVGCTGGRHRSVAIAEWLAKEFGGARHAVNTFHRDVSR